MAARPGGGIDAAPEVRRVVKRTVAGLYVIVDPSACRGRDPASVAAQAIAGGASVIQWRDKTRSRDEHRSAATRVRDACRAGGAIFIVNDFPNFAVELDADGVHVGQGDASMSDARSIVGPDRIVGVSTNNVREAVAAQAGGADYVAVGSIFPTATKGDTRPADIERLRQVEIAVQIPVVAIGGINASNIAQVIDAGAQAAAVISAVCSAGDPAEAARELVAAFDAMRHAGSR
jgi:hydroxymethylpyrimidine kinase/phosphomethylpyrimidine kinase/thiamine-phosphate diphosphorylase